MNVCFVYDCEYPWDVRVEKICDTLIKAGNNVSLVCRNKNAQPDYSELGKLKIYRLPHLGKNALTKFVNATLFFNPLWLLKIHSVAKKEKCKLIIVRDLPLALSGILIGKLKRIPVVIDMAEPYPLTIKQRLRFEPFKFYHIITRNFLLADVLERIVIKTCDHIFCVCGEAKHRLMERGADLGKIAIIRNTPELQKLHPGLPSYPGVLKKLKGKFVVLYVGIIIGGRGIDVAINAMKGVSEERPDVKLVIVGNGKLENSNRELAQRLGLQASVFFEGWVDNNKVPEYLNSCDLGLLPFLNTQHINHTLANKVFDFMAIGKPILCSDVKPMRSIMEETGAGYLFEAGKPLSLAKTILEIIKDEGRKDKGERGIEFARRKYNWALEARKIQSVIQALARG